MMERISREELNLRIAKLIALRSTCQRARVGCVITVDKRIVTTGYNGAAKGEEHCTDESCSSQQACPNSVHAEANAIAYAARKGVKIEDGVAYLTHSPCKTCGKLLVQAGITHVFFIEEYRDSDLDFLRRAGIYCEQITLDENHV